MSALPSRFAEPAPLTNEEYHQMRAAHHQKEIKQTLGILGFNDHAKITLRPEAANAVPLAFVTGLNAEEFNPDKHIMTPTKSAIVVGNSQFMLNQSAAFTAMLLKDSNHEVVVQVKPDAVEKIQKIFATLPGFERMHFIPVPTHDESLTGKFYQAASGVSDRKPIARVDLALYESFAAGLSQPFKPIYAETPEAVANAVAKRALFFHKMSLIAYDLMANTDQDSLRVLSLTALAARRVGGNLLADAAHKQISTNYLETLANEMGFHMPDKKVHCVEIAPGIVDNGIYDDDHAREATVERAMINKFGFAAAHDCAVSIHDLPKLSPMDIGTVALQYLKHAAGEEFHDALPPHIQELAHAGRDPATLKSLREGLVQHGGDHTTVSQGLPSWAMTAGATIGRFAPMQRGYQFVPICPPGQNF